MEELKYIAIKPRGFNFWIWFETKKTVRNLGVFCGENGWGKGGTLTNIKIRESEIEGEIYSKELQYN